MLHLPRSLRLSRTAPVPRGHSPHGHRQPWIHVRGLVLPNYSFWCWENTQTKKKTKGTVALVVAKQAGFSITAAGEMQKGQMVGPSISSLEDSGRHCMWEAWDRERCPGKSWETLRDQSWAVKSPWGMGGPGGWSHLSHPGWVQGPFPQSSCYLGYTHFSGACGRASMHSPCVLDKSSLRHPQGQKGWTLSFHWSFIGNKSHIQVTKNSSQAFWMSHL